MKVPACLLTLVPAAILALALVAILPGLAAAGGGLPGNVARVLPRGTDAVIERSTWEVPRIFSEIQRLGEIDGAEMARVFNLGIGMVLAVPEADAFRALDLLRSYGHQARIVGRVQTGDRRVQLV